MFFGIQNGRMIEFEHLGVESQPENGATIDKAQSSQMSSHRIEAFLFMSDRWLTIRGRKLLVGLLVRFWVVSKR